MKAGRGASIVVGALGLAATVTAVAWAAVPNGNFESGDFTGWEVIDDADVSRAIATGEWQVYKGKLKSGGGIPRGGPEGGPRIGAPPQGEFAAGVSTTGPGTHILHRVLDPNGKSKLNLKLTFHNTASDFANPDTLVAGTTRGMGGFENQQLRIDLLDPAADPYSLEDEDIIKTMFRTKPGDKRRRDWFKLGTNVGGGEFRLRIAEVDNEAPFGVAVDAVKLKKR